MNPSALERHQVWLYLLAIASGLGAGTAWPAAAPVFEALIWPVLALLLFVTFLQVPLLRAREALRDRRFATAVLLGNFVALPALAWALAAWAPLAPAMRLGVLLVLLVPCTDWFITFAQQGRGDVPRAIAVTPLNLVLQLLLLPVYLWFMADASAMAAWQGAALAPALLVVLLPLGAAALTERYIDADNARRPSRAIAIRASLAVWPVPLLALVVFLISGAQVGAVRGVMGELGVVLPVFVLFLLFAALLAKAVATVMGLPADQGRTLAFSMGTRNSFLVLPLALSWPVGWEMAAVVVVVQSLVELFGMVVYVWVVPRWLFR